MIIQGSIFSPLSLLLYFTSTDNIVNYFNIMWVDSVILFLLIVMYLEELLNNDKYFGYVVTLSLSLIISYYISYFILFYYFIYIFMVILF